MVVPLQAESMFGAPSKASASSRFTVRKSMLNRVRFDVFGTDECRWAPENRSTPPGSATTRSCGSSSTGSVGFGCSRVSVLMCWAAVARLVRFHSA